MKKAIHLMVRTNMTQREIAAEIDVNEATISRWKKGKEFEELKLEEERDFLSGLAGLSIQTYKDILVNGTSEHARFMVAQDVLDRTGHKVSDKIDLTGEIDTEISIKIDYGDDGDGD